MVGDPPRKVVAAVLGSTVFFFAAPCVVAGVLPWWISGWAGPRFWPGFVVVGGDYRFVRNPMYVGVVAAIGGQALVFLDWRVLGYGMVAWAVMASFVRWYEEPVLRERYGRQYEEYCRAVPAWIPRVSRR